MENDLQRFLGAMEGAEAYYVDLGVVVREFVQRMQFVETSNGKITNDQRRVMWEHAQVLGLDVNGLAKEANAILGTSYGSPAEMTTDEANRVILELERRQANAQWEAAS